MSLRITSPTSRFLLLFSFLLTQGLGCLAQVSYFHYFNNSYEWYEGGTGEVFFHPNCLNGGTGLNRTFYHFAGQDSFDGHWWYRVHWDEEYWIYCDMGPTILTLSQPGPTVGFHLREDSTGKIFVRNPQGQTALQYDFGGPFAVGDTLWVEDHQKKCKISSIDSLYFGQEARARYWCECTNPPTFPKFIVEGVGANEGFIPAIDFCEQIFDITQYIKCAFKDGHQMTLSLFDTCGIPGHIVVGLEPSTLEDFPIQWRDQSAELRIDVHYQGFHWDLMDMTGRKMAAGELNAESLRLDHLPAGNYLLRLRGNEGEVRAFRFRKLY